MVCDTCGHPNDSHQYATSGLFYCDQCKSLESHVSFSEDPAKKAGNIADLFS